MGLTSNNQQSASSILPLSQISALEVSGLFCREYLLDKNFQDFSQKLRSLNMGTKPNLLTDGLDHWSRTYEYPYTLYGVLRHLEKHRLPSAAILDAACGFSPLPFVLAALGHQVIGVDLDEQLPSLWANYVIPTECPGGTSVFKFGNMERLDFPDNTFDVAFSISSLEHTPNPRIAIRELCRVVKPGGLVLLTCDLEPQGGDGIPLPTFTGMLEELDNQTDYFYPPRWCHPRDTVSFATRPDALSAPWWRKVSRALRPSNNMAVYSTTRLKRK